MKRQLATASLLMAGYLAQAQPTYLQDYPTLERVQFVQTCMREHPGPEFEMQSKCACMLDSLATELAYERYVQLSTEAKAISIGGERGGVLRDNEAVKDEIKQYRAQQARAEKACFLAPAKR
ncbi:hypothetical protein HNP55_004322 [Paucibacter oligotrophus]|uniref:Uncharacterized protein n=1 Tax=Roseateles oligotrophus TaxID=1769250 RepID=A0A840LC86_9BURK|nr:hypothetical protein [Roseateles oligotrophus]MBB4845770.1 hypothetical protein [Roseateles oligotrophus]